MAGPLTRLASGVAVPLASASLCVKNLIIAPPYNQKKAVERLAYSPDDVAKLLGISRELVHDLLRTGQLRSVKAGRRRLISKRHLEAFLAREE